MNFPASKTVSDELLDQLSAYLDGELDESGCHHIENLLATDPRVRDQLRQLELASQALDSLPRSQTNPSFTQSTVEMVALNLADEAEAAMSPRNWSGLRTVLLSAVILASTLTIGYRAIDLALPAPNEQLLGDLPVLEQLDALRQIDNLEFLRKLAASGAFRDDPTEIREVQP